MASLPAFDVGPASRVWFSQSAEPAREILRAPLAVCGFVGPVPDRLDQIARLYVLGLSTTDIGRVLYLSPNTVKTYMSQITDLCGLSMHEVRKRVLCELAVTVGADPQGRYADVPVA